MNKNHNPALTPYAQKLRRDMTREEKHLWYDFLSKLPVRFNRQKVIRCYIVDFYCSRTKLVIELDGSQHYEEAARAMDSERDAFLSRQGLRVLRYSNADVNQRFNGVCEDIWNHINKDKML